MVLRIIALLLLGYNLRLVISLTWGLAVEVAFAEWKYRKFLKRMAGRWP